MLEPPDPRVANRWERSIILPGVVTWLIMALALAWTFSPDPWLVAPPDPDSQLRLVQVRDLLAGQGWFDLTQYRLGGAGGLAMHWSRLIDAPMLAIMAAGDLLLGQGAGQKLLKFIWPVGLYLGFILIAIATACRLGSREAVLPAAILAVLNLDILTFFIPGRLDHHNAQLVLLLVLVYGLVSERADWRAGMVSGLALAMMLVIAMEALPYAVATGIFLPLAWVFDRQTGPDRRLAGFGLTLAAVLGLAYLAVVPAGGFAACDAFSAVYLSAGLIGGLGVAGLSFAAAGHGPLVRIAGLLVIGSAVIAVIAAFFPDCLAGPYGSVSAELKNGWLDEVAEAQPIWSFAAVFPAQAFASFAAPLLATIVAGRHVLGGGRRKETHRQGWICVLVFLLAALAVSIYQYRGTPFLNALSIPVLAVWIADWRRRAVTDLNGPLQVFAVLAIWLAGLQVSYFAIGQGVASVLSPPPAETARTAQPAGRPQIRRADAGATRAERECADPASARALASLPRGRMLSPVFFGPTILAQSDHSVLAGPYHRAETAILDTLRVGFGSDAEARAILDRRGIDYVVICSSSREALLMIQEGKSGLFVDLLQSRPASWLDPVTVNGSYLLIYQVR